MTMTNTSTALVEYDYSNVIPYELIDGKGKKEVKYNKDGSINRSHCNRIAGESSEVYAFQTKKEIADMLEVFDRHIEESTNNEQRQIACRNKLLFIIGINVGIRGSDLRTLKWNFFFR